MDMGDVTLSGTVPSREDIARAVTAARKVPGVRSVHSELGYYRPQPRVRWSGLGVKG